MEDNRRHFTDFSGQKPTLLERFTMREKCPNSEFFWSVFPSIPTEYWDSLCKAPHSAKCEIIWTSKNSETGHFSRTGLWIFVFNSNIGK